MISKIDRLLNIIFIVILVGVVAFVGWFIYELDDMIKNYQCSTTTDIKWYVDNDCLKYYKNPWE